MDNLIIQLHIKEGKMCYWASQGPPHHKWLQCLKKRQHSYKNTIKPYLEKISETTLPKVWKQKRNLSNQLHKLVNLPTEREPFERVPHFIKEDQMGEGDKNSGRTATINTFCSKRKEPLHSNSQTSLPVMINIEELTHVHLILKKFIFQTKNSKMFPNRKDKLISPSLETNDKRSSALGFSWRLPNSPSNWTSTEGSKSTKVKSGTTKNK